VRLLYTEGRGVDMKYLASMYHYRQLEGVGLLHCVDL